jgi:ComF family protein
MLIFHLLRRLIAVLIEVIFPPVCVICFQEGTFLCDRCFSVAVQKSAVFSDCFDNSALMKIYYCCEYKNNLPVKKIIHNFKYENVVDLVYPLAAMMQKTVLQIKKDCKNPLFVPVPLHQKRLKWRGFNQSELIANGIAGLYGLPFANLLRRTRFKRPQMELGKEDRSSNVKDSFALINDPMHFAIYKNSTIILVDDVATTLSTMKECAKVLKEAGFKVVYGLIIARSN